ncbi:hypothetical protein H8356DRAFT_1723651 [Neocallimastix lanati (nom. inval.)]|nr:hypothetical protein H8356DRAFT_1723651 [Neocallimastix sp. JGI-2020a]
MNSDIQIKNNDTEDIKTQESRKILNHSNEEIIESSKKEIKYPLYERLLFRFHILWGFAEFLTNVKPIVISDFYSIINLYTIKPTVVKSGDVKTIR